MPCKAYILSVIAMNVFAARRLAPILKTAVLGACCFALICFSQSCAQGVKSGIELCLNVLVPSLFPFMTVSGLIVKCGAAKRAEKLFMKPTKLFFGLDGSFAPVVLLSLIGGYPVGAKGISELKKQGADNSRCQKAAMLCVCAGPGFLINYVGVFIYGSKRLGIIMYTAQVLSVIIIGVGAKLFYKSNKDFYFEAKQKSHHISFADALTEAVFDSAKAMFSICAYVILFSGITAILQSVAKTEGLSCMTACLLEVCSAVNLMSNKMTIEAVAFAAGFGGLCVHFQIFSTLNGIKVNKLLFFTIRIIQGALTALITHLGLIVFPEARPVFSSAQGKPSICFGTNAASGIVLILTSILFLFSIISLKRR